MDRCKYIMLNTRIPTPILFPPTQEHSDIAEAFGEKDKIKSAGFVEFNYNEKTREVEAFCYGESTSLNMKSEEEDSWLVTQMTKVY